MAARTRKVRHDDFTRDRIKTTQLINRLEDHAFGKVALEPAQVRSIEILLKKALPDLSTVTLEGGNKPLQLETVQRTVVSAKHSNG